MLLKVAKSRFIPHFIKKFISETLTLIGAWFPNNTIRVLSQRLKGVKIGKNTIIEMGVIIDSSKPYLIEIGNNVTLGPGVKILAHGPESYLKKVNGDYDFPEKKEKIVIKDNCYIGAGSVILSGVVIGEYSIVAAGSVVTKSIESYSLYAGIPAKRIKAIKKVI